MEKFEKASKREDGVDLISTMPDHILHLILSNFRWMTKEVIRTSVLSRRWRYLWTSIPSLDLTYFGVNLEKRKFKEFVYWALVNRSADLDTLYISCRNYYSKSTIAWWIHAAVTRNVKILNLNFSPKETDSIELPHCLVTCSSLKELSLFTDYHALRLPNVTGFPALRVLDLDGVDLIEDDALVNNFFLNSFPLLENLTLFNCEISRVGLLCISCPKLKKLSIVNTETEEYLCGGYKISCPKLVYLELRGYIAYNFFFEFLDSLKEAEIEPKLKANIVSVLPGISHVESLLIDIDFFIQSINTALDRGLPNLKNLALITTFSAFNMEGFNRVLKCYPKLESLSFIIVEDLRRDLQECEVRSIFTDDLKQVESCELNGENPQLVINMDGTIFVEIIFRWGSKAKYSHTIK